jgi:hypothetical protein
LNNSVDMAHLHAANFGIAYKQRTGDRLVEHVVHHSTSLRVAADHRGIDLAGCDRRRIQLRNRAEKGANERTRRWQSRHGQMNSNKTAHPAPGYPWTVAEIYLYHLIYLLLVSLEPIGNEFFLMLDIP